MDASSLDVKYNENLSSRLKQLVGNKFCSDLSFVIQDTNERIPAHKLIVALSSPVLHRIVYGNETFPPTDIVKVDGISTESFMEILLYIYTDRINLNEDNVIEILQKSNYFGLTGIESKCLEYLETNLSISTVPWIYHQLFYSASTSLLNKCLQYIRIQPLEFFASEHFEKISIDEMKAVFESDAINCSEVDLFEAMVRLSKAHCAAENLAVTAANQRKILRGSEKLLRLESLTESELDKCLAIQSDFYSTAEVEAIRTNISNATQAVKRKWYTCQDAVWIELNTQEVPASSFYTGWNKNFIHRHCGGEGEEPLIAGSFIELFHNDQNLAVEILCGSEYEWHKCVNGEIPFGSVPISLRLPEPVFIARALHHHSFHFGLAYMNGTMKRRAFDDDGEEEENLETFTEFEILVARNVKHPYTGNGSPSDAIYIGFSENNHKMYMGRAWFEGDLLPAKVVHNQQFEAFVPYGGDEVHVDTFEFVRMDPGTYNWKLFRMFLCLVKGVNGIN